MHLRNQFKLHKFIITTLQNQTFLLILLQRTMAYYV